jgi:hypothetical protein
MTLTVACLTAADAVVEARRAERNAAIGKAQADRWLKTRKTKVANLAGSADMFLDTDRSPKEIGRDLVKHPVVQAILRAKRGS